MRYVKNTAFSVFVKNISSIFPYRFIPLLLVKMMFTQLNCLVNQLKQCMYIQQVQVRTSSSGMPKGRLPTSGFDPTTSRLLFIFPPLVYIQSQVKRLRKGSSLSLAPSETISPLDQGSGCHGGTHPATEGRDTSYGKYSVPHLHLLPLHSPFPIPKQMCVCRVGVVLAGPHRPTRLSNT